MGRTVGGGQCDARAGGSSETISRGATRTKSAYTLSSAVSFRIFLILADAEQTLYGDFCSGVPPPCVLARLLNRQVEPHRPSAALGRKRGGY